MLVKERFVLLMVNIYREVGDNESVDSNGLAVLTEFFNPVLHHGVKVPHQDQRYRNVLTDVFQL